MRRAIAARTASVLPRAAPAAQGVRAVVGDPAAVEEPPVVAGGEVGEQEIEDDDKD